MEMFQACLTEALKFVLLALIAGIGYLGRAYIVPFFKKLNTNLEQKSEALGIELTAEQLATARTLIKEMVSSAYRLKLGNKIEDAKTYVNTTAETELAKLGITLSEELIDELRRAALGELEQTLEAFNTTEN